MTVDTKTVAEQSQAASQQKPGHLVSSVTPSLILHTQIAQLVFRGRAETKNKPEIIGLLGFASQLNLIWNAARQDDPYADWWLIKIEAALHNERHALQQSLKQIKEQFSTMEMVSLPVSKSAKPLTVPLRFSNPYAYQGAYLVADFDELVRTVMTARHFGLMATKDASDLTGLASKSARRAFVSVIGYKPLDMTRDDINRESDKAKRAKALMGDVPSDILAEQTRAQYAPEPVRENN